jgi:hypothetical protein
MQEQGAGAGRRSRTQEQEQGAGAGETISPASCILHPAPASCILHPAPASCILLLHPAPAPASCSCSCILLQLLFYDRHFLPVLVDCDVDDLSFGHSNTLTLAQSFDFHDHADGY